MFSCSKDKDSSTDENEMPAPLAIVSFAADVHPIFLTNCNGVYCHGGGADGKNFTTHADVIAISGEKIIGAINHSAGFEAMPKSQMKLSQGKIDTITTWINEGGLDN